MKLVEFAFSTDTHEALAPFEHCKLRITAYCLYCEEPRTVLVKLRTLPEHVEDIPTALDRKAAALCPCCLDAIWQDGGPATHRGTQRRLVREALLALPTAEEYDEKREALRTNLAELQPASKTSRK